MVFIMDDSFKKDKGVRDMFARAIPKVDHPHFKFKPWDPAEEIIMNSRIASLKNAPIKHSDKMEHGVVCRPIPKYNGRTDPALPRMKSDLRGYKNIC